MYRIVKFLEKHANWVSRFPINFFISIVITCMYEAEMSALTSGRHLFKIKRKKPIWRTVMSASRVMTISYPEFLQKIFSGTHSSTIITLSLILMNI